MRNLFLVALIWFSLASHGQIIEMEWSGDSNDGGHKNCVPTVEVDYAREEIIVKVNEAISSALVVVSDDYGNYTCTNVTSGNYVSFDMNRIEGEDIRLDVYANGKHGFGCLQKED